MAYKIDELKKKYLKDPDSELGRGLRGAERRKKLKKPNLSESAYARRVKDDLSTVRNLPKSINESIEKAQQLDFPSVARQAGQVAGKYVTLAGKAKKAERAFYEPLQRVREAVGARIGDWITPRFQYGAAKKGVGSPVIGVDTPQTIGSRITESFDRPLENRGFEAARKLYNARDTVAGLRDQDENVLLADADAVPPDGAAGVGAKSFADVQGGGGSVEYRGKTLTGTPSELKQQIAAARSGSGPAGIAGPASDAGREYSNALERFAQKQREFADRNAPGGENARRFRKLISTPRSRTVDARQRDARRQEAREDKAAERIAKGEERVASRDTAIEIANIEAGKDRAVTEERARRADEKNLPERTARFNAWEQTEGAQALSPAQRNQFKGSLAWYAANLSKLNPESSNYDEGFANTPNNKRIVNELREVGLV